MYDGPDETWIGAADGLGYHGLHRVVCAPENAARGVEVTPTRRGWGPPDLVYPLTRSARLGSSSLRRREGRRAALADPVSHPPVMPWVIDIDQGPRGEPVFLRIVRAVTEDIRRGRLLAGTRLPGTRTLARSLGVNRNTVVAAFDELVAEGWLTASRASATRVSDTIPEPSGLGAVSPDKPAPLSAARGLGERALVDAGPAINLSAGYPDLSLLPAEQLARAYRRAIKFGPASTLSYSDPRGVPALREAIAEFLSATRGLAAGPSRVMVTRGSQMAFAIVADSLLPPGARIAVEALGYTPAWAAFRRRGGELLPVPIDEEGMQVERLIDLHDRQPVSAVYVTPHHQYPTTVTLSAGRRLRLLDFAARTGVTIIEDDYDHEFAFSGRPTLPLASMDRTGRVIYIGTLSKVFAPGPRVGFLIATEDRIDSFAACRALIDACGDPAIETAVAELFVSGELRRHINRVRTVYARRQQIAVESIERHLRGAVDYRLPSGGTALWLRARDHIDVDKWAAATERRGVSFYPGGRYSLEGTSIPYLRMNFAAVDDSRIVQGIEAMARALDDLPLAGANTYAPTGLPS